MFERSAMKLIVVLAACATLAASPALRAEDWPQWRGVARTPSWTDSGVVERFAEDGLVGVEDAPSARLAGVRWCRGGASSSWTTGNGRRSRTMDGMERLVALDDETGAVLWEAMPAIRNLQMESPSAGATPAVDGERGLMSSRAPGMPDLLRHPDGRAVAGGRDRDVRRFTGACTA